MKPQPTRIVKSYNQFTPRPGGGRPVKSIVFLCNDDREYSKDDLAALTGFDSGDKFYWKWWRMGRPASLAKVRKPNREVLDHVDVEGRLPMEIIETYHEVVAPRARVLVFLCDNGKAYNRDALGEYLGITGGCFYQRWKRFGKPSEIALMRDTRPDGGATAEYLALSDKERPGSWSDIPEPTEFDRLYGMGR